MLHGSGSVRRRAQSAQRQQPRGAGHDLPFGTFLWQAARAALQESQQHCRMVARYATTCPHTEPLPLRHLRLMREEWAYRRCPSKRQAHLVGQTWQPLLSHHLQTIPSS